MIFLLGFVWFVNFSIISFDMMYPEQPLIYLANQSIHSIRDLFLLYLHPKMFHLAILFFRPSGHFLMYQFLEQFFSWQNTKALIMVNLGFLALSGFVLIKLYELLFPRFKVGAYLAFSIYLMHPALMLSRLIILHFEFAHVFFVLLSLYCFVLFCRKNLYPNEGEAKGTSPGFYLFFSLLFFPIAVTFKEPALMLGPVLLVYFSLSLYKQQKLSVFMLALIKEKKSREILSLIAVLTLILAFYLSFQWPSLSHPMRTGLKAGAILEAGRKFFMMTLGLQTEALFPPPVWRNVIFPPITQLAMGVLFLVSLISTALAFTSTSLGAVYKKSLFFLYLCAFLFLILPLTWAWGLPWHLGLSLIFISMIMGFSCEYTAGLFIKNRGLVDKLGIVLALCLGLTTIWVDRSNIAYISAKQGYELALGHNAVFSPPNLGLGLNDESIIVVEDSQLHDSYLLGASIYPYAQTLLSKPNLGANEARRAEEIQNSLLLKQQPLYNGSLFRWAYLRPALQEEVYPFQVEHMDKVPTIILYNWLQHYKNIFCLGYDQNANWQDRTVLFKKNLLLEKKKRHLVLHNYEMAPAIALEGRLINELSLAFPDYQFCQLACDQDKQCKGFTYLAASSSTQFLNKCYFYEELSFLKENFCPSCLGFYKKEAKG